MVLENKKHVVPRLDYFENQGVMTGSKEFPRVDHMIDEFRYKLETVGESIKGYVWHPTAITIAGITVRSKQKRSFL